VNTDSQNAQSEQVFETLFEHAQRRPAPPGDQEQAIRGAVYAEWQRRTGRRSLARRPQLWALAASIAVAAFLAWTTLQPIPEVAVPHRVATLDRQVGEVKVVHGEGVSPVSVVNGTLQLSVGQTLVTGEDSAVALKWLRGGSLRADANTRIRIASPLNVELLAGRIYFDSGYGTPASSSQALIMVKTFAGDIRHVGTQFMADVADGTLTVSVRKGVVAVDNSVYDGVTSAGQQLAIERNGRYSVGATALYGELWQWVETVVPVFDMNNKRVIELLQWVSNETGRALNFESAEAERIARSQVLHGQADIEPIRALQLFLQTTDLRWELQDNVIRIRVSSARH
jgi:ferric-dicitrate binding protein FerR (iron transport regulator)